VAATNGADIAFKIGAVIALGGGVMVALIRFGGIPGRSVVDTAPTDETGDELSHAEPLNDSPGEILPVGAQV
jgi:hypothetical protein